MHQYLTIALVAFAFTRASTAILPGSPSNEPKALQDMACPRFQQITVDEVDRTLLKDTCLPLAEGCLRDGIDQLPKLSECIADSLAMLYNVCGATQTISTDKGTYLLWQDGCMRLAADKCLPVKGNTPTQVAKCIVDAFSESQPAEDEQSRVVAS
ncbi:hypothetical protein NOR_00634 [Metarhizium rileyi]|uniref:Secreted protein n=1 Tax=Metarhizium rileyi (strain RCEF 4871) TaxID=1649241 RepID=A0A167KQF0_METRR|nr:hypothetical protein NOR_00634 [Metarhizium rileyi RCEF 4871]